MGLPELNPDQRRTVQEMIAHHRVTSYIQLEGVAEENWRKKDIRGDGFEDPEVFDALFDEDKQTWEIYDAVRKKADEIREKAEARASKSPL